MILTAMNNKTIKGYWSNGRFVKPEEILAEEPGPPSKTPVSYTHLTLPTICSV